MKTRRAALLLLLSVAGSLITVPSAAAQEGEPVPLSPTYSLGNQVLIINAGLFVPLFFQALDGSIAATNLSLGGVGSLQWSSYLNNDMTLGIEGGGMFAFSPNNRSLFMLPLTVRYTYFLRWYPWEMPLSIAAGMNFTRLGDSFQLLPILKPGVSFYWNYSYEWAFGLNCIYWWSPNLYSGPEPPSSQSRLGNFLEITLSALYHF